MNESKTCFCHDEVIDGKLYHVISPSCEQHGIRTRWAEGMFTFHETYLPKVAGQYGAPRREG